ncbi:hypothetical protein T069G_01513 [Trichoderma breve]|uniref:Uncharacterized protein n=1 Tax=Trichoderma breve TaxID=2034170 RepID=A0A9W9EDU5_9HYPO|nr:hypothetical protein T069G_01513 [Trichoderma breve]KAJ4864983.1 hypothetical protein T069G_01513 [Trichoderma breve]
MFLQHVTLVLLSRRQQNGSVGGTVAAQRRDGLAATEYNGECNGGECNAMPRTIPSSPLVLRRLPDHLSGTVQWARSLGKDTPEVLWSVSDTLGPNGRGAGRRADSTSRASLKLLYRGSLGPATRWAHHSSVPVLDTPLWAVARPSSLAVAHIVWSSSTRLMGGISTGTRHCSVQGGESPIGGEPSVARLFGD